MAFTLLQCMLLIVAIFHAKAEEEQRNEDENVATTTEAEEQDFGEVEKYHMGKGNKKLLFNALFNSKSTFYVLTILISVDMLFTPQQQQALVRYFSLHLFLYHAKPFTKYCFRNPVVLI